MPPPRAPTARPRPPSPAPPAARRRTIRKAAPLIILLLWGVAGATLNVAVAWGLAMMCQPSWPHLRMKGNYHWPADGRLWQVHLFRQFGAAELLSDVHSLHLLRPDSILQEIADREPKLSPDSLPAWSVFHRRLQLPNPYTVRREYAYGWPSLAMTWLSENVHQVNGKGLPTNGLPEWRTQDLLSIGNRSLPLGIHGPGFAINTLFYAGVLWMLFCGPFALRRMIRRRRGQCPACAYPIGQSPVCTECGASLGKGQMAMGNGAKE